MKEKTLNVQAIENGTVIDHITTGQGLNILKHFQLDKIGNNITVGFNLKSKRSKSKDLIKLENIFFSDEESSQIALFAAKATINIIKNYKVTKKITPNLPIVISNIFECINSNCASHGEPVISEFKVKLKNDNIKLKCIYCEKEYSLEWFIKK